MILYGGGAGIQMVIFSVSRRQIAILCPKSHSKNFTYITQLYTRLYNFFTLDGHRLGTKIIYKIKKLSEYMPSLVTSNAFFCSFSKSLLAVLSDTLR